MQCPDSPGWWAFEGSEWESEPVYIIKGITYYGFQQEWEKAQEEHFHRYELHLYEPQYYRDVPGEPFKTIVHLQWAYEGTLVSARKSSGRHEGAPVLGFLSPKYRWNHALYDVATWTGEWTKLTLPWDQAEPKEKEMPAMLVVELERKFNGAKHELNEVEQILGEALGYPRYVDDPKNFPEATEADGVCVGEMTPALLAAEIAKQHALLTEQNTSFLVQAMEKGTKLAQEQESYRDLAKLFQQQTELFKTQKELEQAQERAIAKHSARADASQVAFESVVNRLETTNKILQVKSQYITGLETNIGDLLDCVRRFNRMVYDVPDEEMPKPDWKDVPEQYTWWTVDCDGEFRFWTSKPVIQQSLWYHSDIGHFDEDVVWQPEGSCFIEIPLGIDWRTLIQHRP